MIQLLLKLLGVKMEAAQEVASVSVQLRQASWLGWVVFIGLLLGVYTWWAYRYMEGHRHLEKGRRILLASLRIFLFVLLLFILLRPVFSFVIETRLRRTLVVLMDKSASMNIEDLRREEADLKRAGIGKGAIEKMDQAFTEQQAGDLQHIARTALVKAVFENNKLDLVNNLKKRYDLEYLDFNRGVAPADEEKALKSPPPDNDASQSTAIGDAIREVINRKRGQPVAGIFMVTDGANNAGSEPLEAANAAHQENMPLYIYGVGITSPRDVIVESVFTPEVAFIKDEAPVTVRVRSQSLKGEKGRLTLKLDGEEVAWKDVEFTDGEQAVAMTFTPDKAGLFDLTATITPREDETVKDNNTASQRVRVIDSKIKVLYIEQAPRWEFRFIQSALLRDRRVDAEFLLLQADPMLAKAEGSPYLDKFPATKEELFKYDLVVIGDVDSKIFSPEQMDEMNEFVSKFGGAMIFIAGQQADPSAYQGTPFEKLLPVEIAIAGMNQRDYGDHPTTLALTPTGRDSAMLKLAADDQENANIWKNFPPIHWINRVSRAKPAAQVLLEDTDIAKATRFGKMPAMALQQYGVGQVLYIGTDDTWRWRQETGVTYYPLLWGQIIQRMALAHLLGGSKRTQLSVDKQRYTTAERVTVFARLYDQNFEPVIKQSVNGFYTVGGKGRAESSKQGVTLRALPGQPGMYRGDFVPVEAGTYKFYVESDPKTTIDFEVTKPRFELGDTAMNEPALKEMARISGGAFFREEDLANLEQSLSLKDERLSRVVDADIWSSPFYLLLIVTVATVEWVLRKRSELK